MTSEQKFTLWIKYAMTIFVVIFAYFLLADFKIPLTPQAMVTRGVTKVVPRVNGTIVAINIKNNQRVEPGEVLFSIDSAPYQLALEKALLQVQLAKQANLQLDASLAAAKANLKAIVIVSRQKQQYVQRLDALFARHSVSEQQKDDAESAAVGEQANLLAAKARLKELQVSRGDVSDDNVKLRVAGNQLKQAELNLSYTQVRAQQGGIVTNLQLEVGAYATSGQPLLALVSSKAEVIADFREKSARYAVNGSPALITFDGNPGHLYKASVISTDAGVSVGQFAANGSLATPSVSTRWVRDAQRMRLHLVLNDAHSEIFPSGAKATVQLMPDSGVFAWLAKTQIGLLSLLHYIY
ncbi:MAG: multidrug resistance efflux pump [Psychromonas sp.]|jgi:multidrug resistance efflux pump|uniref:HlyD family secretion protein n=1 Tax=Psychromonas sp. TaxID=1884585 RepID=UPI0039E656B9